MNGLSLFSGIGGLDAAFEGAGGRIVAMCEIEPFCRAVLTRRWPDVPIFGDIKTLRGDDIGTPIDIIFGGPPCQPVSLAGRRRGQDDERYLWGDVFRIVADVMPRFCVFENVPGILSIAADDICQSLVGIGYSVGICCFEAAAVGAPHRRARVFFVGYAERCGLSGEPRRRTGEESEDGYSDVADRDGSRQLQQGGSFGEFGERAGNGCKDVSDAESGGRNVTSHAQPGEHKESEGTAGRSYCSVPDSTRQRCGTRRSESERFSRESGIAHGSRREPEPGLGGGFDGVSSWLDGTWERDIPRVARDVPDRVSRLKALGNAVVPAQAELVFRAIMEVENA